MEHPPKSEYLASLVEHESCITLKHAKCWNPESKLKTPREEGAGFGQITRAYKQDGTIRFDALKELRSKHPNELKELDWSNVYSRPDLQLRALILKMRDNFQYYSPYAATFEDAYAFSDAAYNGGIGGVDSERRACKMASWCDPRKWENNVEKLCLKSKAALYGNRSACDINRHHVEDVTKTRAKKYKPYFSK